MLGRVVAVNAEGSVRRWGYAILRHPKDLTQTVEAWLAEPGRKDGEEPLAG